MDLNLLNLPLLHLMLFWGALLGVVDSVLGGWLLRRLGRPLPGSDARFAFLIPAIAALVGAGADLLKTNAANKSVSEQEKLYNDYLAERKSATNELISNLGANGVNIYGPQVSTAASTTSQQGTSSQRGTTSQQGTSTTAPTLSPEYQGLVSSAQQILGKRLSGGSGLPAGYVENAVSGIEAAAAPQRQAEKNIAARHGLSQDVMKVGSPTETSVARQIADVKANAPLQARQLQNEDIASAANLASTFGKGQTSTQAQTGTTTGSTSASQAGTNSQQLTAPPNLSELANLLLPPSPQAGTQTGISPTGSALSGLGSALASLLASGAFGSSGTVSSSVPTNSILAGQPNLFAGAYRP